jgi:hypothetical protein
MYPDIKRIILFALDLIIIIERICAIAVNMEKRGIYLFKDRSVTVTGRPYLG